VIHSAVGAGVPLRVQRPVSMLFFLEAVCVRQTCFQDEVLEYIRGIYEPSLNADALKI
jgi:hypothetical protein